MDFDSEGSIILLGSLPDTTDYSDGWFLGKKFIGHVAEPVVISSIEDFEEGTLVPIYKSTPIMRKDLYDAIISTGADNLEAWNVRILKSDGSLLSDSYKAINIIGLVRGAGINTLFAPENPSRILDASIESLDFVPPKDSDLLIFRLAEQIGTVIVHQKVKDAIETRRIENIIFEKITGTLSTGLLG